MDMTIGEYEEIGDLIKEYASDEATVVVGTSIDMDMKDEIRVTVVATGLNKSVKQKQFKSVEIVRNATNNQIEQPIRASRDDQGHGEDSRPVSGHAVVDQLRDNKPAEDNDDYLDIPTFLRNQLDWMVYSVIE